MLALYLALWAADFTWRITTTASTATPSGQPQPVPQTSKTHGQLTVAGLKSLNLFGRPGQPVKAAEPEPTNAPVTRLQVKLTGVVSSSTPDRGVAIIEHRGAQGTYGVGEKIEGTQASVSEVYVDRVMLKNAGRTEVLMLDENAKPSTPPPRPRAQPDGSDRSVTRLSVEDTDLDEKVANFSDYISLAPQRKDGQLEGFLVSPGKHPELFQQAGLQRNDVVTQLNGVDLTNMQDAIDAIKNLPEADALELTILRDGELQTLYIELPEK